jgi:hypothetical protein
MSVPTVANALLLSSAVAIMTGAVSHLSMLWKVARMFGARIIQEEQVARTRIAQSWPRSG